MTFRAAAALRAQGSGKIEGTVIFMAGLTNVNVLVTVRDTSTGESRVYVNPQGPAFQPVQDTETFSKCP